MTRARGALRRDTELRAGLGVAIIVDAIELHEEGHGGAQLGEELAKKLGDLPARGKGGSGISLPGMGEAHIRIGG